MTDRILSNRSQSPINRSRAGRGKPASNAVTALASQFESTRRALGEVGHYSEDGKLRGTSPKPAAVVSLIDVRSPIPSADPARLIGGLPSGTDAGTVSSFDQILLASSAVLQAGARLIVRDDVATAVDLPRGGLAFQSEETRFDIIRPASWHHVPDGDDVPVTPPAIISNLVDMTGARSLGVRVDLSRAQQRQFASDGVMAAEVLTSFALGLGHALDQQFLESLLLSEPEIFSLTKLASGGFQADEARAIVGRNATGAAVEPANGRLHVQGISARLTHVASETLVLVANRHAIAVDPEIRVISERTSTAGAMTLTAWASVQPIYGDLSAAWKVTA